MIRNRIHYSLIIGFSSGSQSPDCIRSDTLSALEMSRVALWSMYNNNASPPTSNNTTSPPSNEPQRCVHTPSIL